MVSVFFSPVGVGVNIKQGLIAPCELNIFKQPRLIIISGVLMSVSFMRRYCDLETCRQKRSIEWIHLPQWRSPQRNPMFSPIRTRCRWSSNLGSLMPPRSANLYHIHCEKRQGVYEFGGCRTASFYVVHPPTDSRNWRYIDTNSVCFKIVFANKPIAWEIHPN